MSNYSNRKLKRQQQGILEVIIVSLFKVIWWIVTLPFKKAKKETLSNEERGVIVRKRSEIESLLKSESIIELKHAVMEADKLVDYILRAIGASGETFADRLRSQEEKIPRSLYNDIWQGHKVRNQLAHEQENRISNTELREAARKLLNYHI